MQNAITIETITNLTMSSREIAELVESRHDSVKRCIERLSDKGLVSFTPAVETSHEADPAALAEMASKLEGFVYDPELASELAPAFVAMSAVEGFDKVMELFAAKEKQIEALNVGGKEQKSTPAVQEKPVEGEPKPKSATDILRERAKAQTK